MATPTARQGSATGSLVTSSLQKDRANETHFKNEQKEQTEIHFQDYWDVVAPAPKNSIKGQLAKGMFRTLGKHRRVSLEVHRIPIPKIPSGLDVESDDSDGEDEDDTLQSSFVEKAFLRVSKKRNGYKPPKAVLVGDKNISSVSVLDDDESSAVSVDMSVVEFSKDRVNGHEVYSTPLAAVDENVPIPSQEDPVEFHFGSDTLKEQQHTQRNQLGLSTIIQKEKYYTKHKFEVSNVKVVKTERNAVTLHIKPFLNDSNNKEVREIYFDSSDEAVDFVKKLEELQRMDSLCRMRNFDKFITGLDIKDEDMDVKINFLIEIVGAEKLVVSDIKSSDPYVVAQFDNMEIHRTKYISKNLNPIWTLRKNAFFIFSVSPRDLFTTPRGLNFIVYDFDMNGKHDILGAASLPSKILYLANEERLEMKLKPMIIGKQIFPKVSLKDPNIGTLAVRCRRATEYDLEFMAKFNEDPKKGKFLTQGTTKLNGPTMIKTAMTNYKKTFRDDLGNKVDKYKVRPSTDPDNPLNEWMTTEEIDAEVMKKSRSFKTFGSGGIAKIHLEILSCDDLPNLENIQLFGNKTDAFVQVVYEDYISETCVINDSNAPRWLPWTNRALTLHSKYPSSPIYIGVHDYDAGAQLLSDHDLVGRCTVDVSNLKPNTEYLLDYALYNTSMKPERKQQGTVKIRLRVEIDDPRAYLLAAFKIPPPIYVNTKDAKKFHCLRYTINGDYNVSAYSLQTIIMLGNELMHHIRVFHYAKKMIADCFFWRPTTKFSIRVPWFLQSDDDIVVDSGATIDKYTVEKDVFIPLNSIVVFVAGVLVVENPQLLPSLSFFSLASFLMITKNFRSSHPNPWWRCTSFTDMCRILLLGKQATLAPESIAVNESAAVAKAADEEWEKLIQEAEEKGAKLRAEIAAEQQELEKDLQEVKGDADDLSTKVGNVRLDPLVLVKPYLYPVQTNLVQICHFVRFVKNVIQWEESHYSFFLTLSSFALAVTFIFLPWIFILQWLARILVWVAFGPWMLFLDPIRRQKLNPEDALAREAIHRLKRKMDRDKTLSHARIQNENAKKYLDFKMFFFGKYLTRVPIFRADRYLDLPLPSSYAVPIEKQVKTFGELAIEENGAKECEMGQHLVGVMIPKVRETAQDNAAPIGQVVKQKSMVEGGVGSGIGNDSATITYAKLGSIAVFAAVVSYLSVPVLTRMFEGLLYILDWNQEL